MCIREYMQIKRTHSIKILHMVEGLTQYHCRFKGNLERYIGRQEDA